MSQFLRTILVVLGLGVGLAGTAHAQAAFTNQGNIGVNITIDLATPNIISTTLTCEAAITVTDASGINTETGDTSGTVSGTVGSCSVNIPYGWILASPSTATWTITYTVSAQASTGTILRSGIHSAALSAAVPSGIANTGFNEHTKL